MFHQRFCPTHSSKKPCDDSASSVNASNLHIKHPSDAPHKGALPLTSQRSISRFFQLPQLTEIAANESTSPTVLAQNPQNKTPAEIQRHGLFLRIHELYHYGLALQEEGSLKGAMAIELSQKLRSKASVFFKDNYTPSGLNRLKAEFFVLFNDQKTKAEMRQYRASYGTILKNIATALTGIGALIIVGNLCYSKATTGRALFLFQKKKTTGEEKIEAIKQCWRGLSLK